MNEDELRRFVQENERLRRALSVAGRENTRLRGALGVARSTLEALTEPWAGDTPYPTAAVDTALAVIDRALSFFTYNGPPSA